MRRLEQLLPHTGRMRLIDRVTSYDDERIVCESDSHRAADHPLAQDGVLSIVCGLEYGAQAMAIHGALLASAPSPTSSAPGAAPPGYLVTASDLTWNVERLDQCAAPLVIEAISEFRSGNQVAYRFELRVGDEAVLTGRASVLLAT
ncbi:MAG TPA: hydroxymyristoyl-ACP dehydratase [Burkholderiaceae bacterium]|nr:hydroxymyristoyl-ACP dehydratase [Burkholderiaceae bacterium]